MDVLFIGKCEIQNFLEPRPAQESEKYIGDLKIPYNFFDFLKESSFWGKKRRKETIFLAYGNRVMKKRQWRKTE